MSERKCKHKVKKSFKQVICSKKYKFQNNHTYFSDRDKFFEYKRSLTIKYQVCSICGKEVEMRDIYYTIYKTIFFLGGIAGIVLIRTVFNFSQYGLYIALGFITYVFVLDYLFINFAEYENKSSSHITRL